MDHSDLMQIVNKDIRKIFVFFLLITSKWKTNYFSYFLVSEGVKRRKEEEMDQYFIK